MKIAIVFFLFILYSTISQSERVFDANGNLISKEKEVIYEILQDDGRSSIRPYMPTGRYKEIKQYYDGDKHVIQLRVLQDEVKQPINPLSYDANGTTTTTERPIKKTDTSKSATTLRQGEIDLLPIEKKKLIIERQIVQDKINFSIRQQEEQIKKK